MSTTKKYISVDAADDTTNDTIKMQNPDNEVHGTLYTKDSNDQQKDIREIFIKKDALDDIEEIDVSEDADPGFNIETIAEKFNQMLNALKGIAPLILFLCGASVVFGADPVGKAKLRYIGANQYVVTNEVDNVFQEWLDGETIAFPNTSTAGFYIGNQSLSELIKGESDPQFNEWAISPNIGVGLGNLPTYNSVAIGSYMTKTNYYPDTPNYNFFPSYTTETGYLRGSYSLDYSGPSVANDRSVAIGTAAQARDTVTIALGVGALANGLHGPSDQSNWVEFSVPRIGVVLQDGQYVTNELPNATVMLDPYMYERWPDVDYSKWNLVQTIGGTNIYERPYSGLIDPRYCSAEEFQMYNKWMSSGQGPIKYSAATYGVAIGYRSLVSGYHTLALGHYARAYRPHCVAIGPSSHIKAEGSIGLGYYNIVETNSPFSLAIGSNVNIQPGITNAIVIGVPQPNFSKRFTEEYRNKGNSKNDLASVYVYSQKPRAMKSNSINFVFNGNGLNDVFIDDVPMPDRMATDVRMVGCLNSNGKYDRASQIENEIRDMVGIPANDSSMVMFSRDGGLRIYTKKYLDAVDGDDAETIDASEKIGCVDDVWINGKNLGDIIRNISGGSISQQFLDYKASVSNAAETAKASISSATNMQDIKNALNTFFDSIK